MKTLVIYYSRKGENYFNGSIKSIAKGNTEIVAEFIRDAVGADLFEVDTVKVYDESYMTCIDEAKAELNGVTLESLVVAVRGARAVRVAAGKGLLKTADFPLLCHVDEILTDKKTVNIPWEAFTLER